MSMCQHLPKPRYCWFFQFSPPRRKLPTKNVKDKKFMEWNACKGRDRNGHTAPAPGKKRRPSRLQHSKANAHVLFFSVEEQPYTESSSSTLAAQSLAGSNRAMHKTCGRSEYEVIGHVQSAGSWRGRSRWHIQWPMRFFLVSHGYVYPGTFRGQFLHGSCSSLFLKGYFKEEGQ